MPPSTNLKKEKGFFLLNLKRPHLARLTSVASAQRDATLMNPESVRFFTRNEKSRLTSV
jgi:hypothetical protein